LPTWHYLGNGCRQVVCFRIPTTLLIQDRIISVNYWEQIRYVRTTTATESAGC